MKVYKTSIGLTRDMIKIKIPIRFKIGATGARVRFKQDLHSDEGFNGIFNKRTGELEIESRLCGDILNKTFGHELMEVIKENYNLKIPEEDMSSIANGWIEFLEQIGVEFDWSDIVLSSDTVV